MRRLRNFIHAAPPFYNYRRRLFGISFLSQQTDTLSRFVKPFCSPVLSLLLQLFFLSFFLASIETNDGDKRVGKKFQIFFFLPGAAVGGLLIGKNKGFSGTQCVWFPVDLKSTPPQKKTFCYFFPNASMIRIRSVCDYAIVRAAAMWEWAPTSRFTLSNHSSTYWIPVIVPILLKGQPHPPRPSPYRFFFFPLYSPSSCCC